MFSWDARKALKNYEKHGVSFEEVVTVFSDSDALDLEDDRHSAGEPRNHRLGSSMQGRVLLIVYTLRRLPNGTETIRIISARQASRKERQAYAR